MTDDDNDYSSEGLESPDSDDSSLQFADTTQEQVQYPADAVDARATTFADPQDLRRYKAAKAAGWSENAALAVGDNGVGAWGKDTTSTTTPMVALPPDTPGFAPGKQVEVYGPKGAILATVEDKMPASNRLKGKGSIDLNPAATLQTGTTGLTPVKWRWADQKDEFSTRLAQEIASAPKAAGDIQASDVQPMLDSQDAADQSDQADTGAGDVSQKPISKPSLSLSRIVQSKGKLLSSQDGIDKYQNGLVVNKGAGTVIYHDPATNHVFQQGADLAWQDITPVQPKPTMIGGAPYTMKDGTLSPVPVEGGIPPKPLPVALDKMLTDRKIPPVDEKGNPISATVAMQKINEFDKSVGALTPVQEKLKEKFQTQLSGARASLPIRNYGVIKGNFDTLYDNANSENRTGADDAALLQAFAGIEKPGYAATNLDYEEMLKAAGIRGKLSVTGKRLKAVLTGDEQAGGRLIPDAMVEDIKNAAQRATRSRRKTYMSAVQPFIKDMKNQGIDPTTVISPSMLDVYDGSIPDINAIGEQGSGAVGETPKATVYTPAGTTVTVNGKEYGEGQTLVSPSTGKRFVVKNGKIEEVP